MGIREADVREPTYQGVSVNHPSIVATIKKMAKEGRKKEEIARIVGMPMEVVERHSRDAERK